jgi:hypothetical protein
MTKPKKYATILFGLALVLASVVAAPAKVDRACIREATETFGPEQAKRICNSKNYVKPHEYGWVCEAGGQKIYKAKGQGARRKRDAICE